MNNDQCQLTIINGNEQSSMAIINGNYQWQWTIINVNDQWSMPVNNDKWQQIMSNGNCTIPNSWCRGTYLTGLIVIANNDQ